MRNYFDSHRIVVIEIALFTVLIIFFLYLLISSNFKNIFLS